MGKRKPWLNYHKAGAPVREFNATPKRPRELFYARLWLLVGASVGAHRFYLWRPRSAIIWLLGYNVFPYVPAYAVESFFPESNGRVWLTVLVFIWVVIVAIECFRLNKMVVAANRKEFGREAIHNNGMQGQIGPYGPLQRTSLILCALLLVLVLFEIWTPGYVYAGFVGLSLISGVSVWMIHYTITLKRIRKGSTND